MCEVILVLFITCTLIRLKANSQHHHPFTRNKKGQDPYRIKDKLDICVQRKNYNIATDNM